MGIVIRIWEDQEGMWSWLLHEPSTVVVDGESYPSPEELWQAACDGIFEDLVHFQPGESCGADDEVSFSQHLPDDYQRQSDRVWSWGCFWGSHLETYGKDAEYAAAFDAFRERWDALTPAGRSELAYLSELAAEENGKRRPL